MNPVHIPLTQGKSTVIDADHAEMVSGMKLWAVEVSPDKWYARGWVKGREVYLHRFLSNTTGKDVVDHINGDGLDNRSENLRVCSHSQNIANRMDVQVNNSTGFSGVILSRNGKRFIAQLKHRGKRIYLGVFDSPEDAARARDRKAIEIWGEFAFLNFPKENY